MGSGAKAQREHASDTQIGNKGRQWKHTKGSGYIADIQTGGRGIIGAEYGPAIFYKPLRRRTHNPLIHSILLYTQNAGERLRPQYGLSVYTIFCA